MGTSISGLSGSGLDITQIISDMMAVERIPYTKLETKKTQLQDEQSVFRQINTKLKTLDTALFELKYSFNLQAFKATSSSNTITATAGNDAIPGAYKINVIQAAEASTAKTTGAAFLNAVRSGDLKLGDIDFSDAAVRNQLNIDGTSDDTALLNKVVNYINSNSTAASSTATMLKKDDGTYSVHLTSKDSSSVQITSSTLVSSAADPDDINLTVTAGQKAQFTVNGELYERNSNTVSDIIPGVSFTLSDDATSSTITVSADIDKVAEKIQTFVTAYNDLISSVRTNLAPPDTKDAINPLQGDSLLKDINSRLYNIFNEVTSAGFMEQIGLSIDKGITKGSDMTGKITFNKDTFASAFAENPTKVNTILTNISEQMSNTITKTWTSTATGVLSTKIAGYDSELKRVDERLEIMDRSLEMKEARLKLQFNTMETMLTSLNSTKSWLESQFEALTKSNK